MSITRRAGIAALVIFSAFAMHTLNALYIEPNFLGFRNPQVDYAKIALLQNAVGSVPWTLSGFGHLFSGFAMVYLALAGREMFRGHDLVPARVAMMAGLLGSAGFLMTGISDLVGGGVFKSGMGAVPLMAAQNPDLERAATLAQALARITYNSLAQVGLGWYAVLVSWCGRHTGLLPRSFCWFGYFSGFCGMIMGIAFVPLYLYTVLIWSAWYAVVLLRLPARPSAQVT
jgi:hypothetical protein